MESTCSRKSRASWHWPSSAPMISPIVPTSSSQSSVILSLRYSSAYEAAKDSTRRRIPAIVKTVRNTVLAAPIVVSTIRMILFYAQVGFLEVPH